MQSCFGLATTDDYKAGSEERTQRELHVGMTQKRQKGILRGALEEPERARGD